MEAWRSTFGEADDCRLFPFGSRESKVGRVNTSAWNFQGDADGGGVVVRSVEDDTESVPVQVGEVPEHNPTRVDDIFPAQCEAFLERDHITPTGSNANFAIQLYSYIREETRA